MWDKLEAQAALQHGYTSSMSDTFVRVCKSLKLPMEQHTMYKQWCIKHHTNPYGGKLIEQDLPMEKNDKGYVPKLAPNWFFPYPTGCKWREMNSEPEIDMDKEHTEYVEALYAEVCKDIRNQPKGGPMTFEPQTTSFEVARAYTTLAQRQSREGSKKKFKIKKKRRGPPQSEGWPSSVKQALNSDKPDAWKKAIATEIDKLTERGVFLHNQTVADILSQGITTKVVPLGLYLTEKYDENGELLTHQTRQKPRAKTPGFRSKPRGFSHF